jgi:large subunit ribosomal protein L21
MEWSFSMYAIISDGTHQYRVEEGLVFDIQRKDIPAETATIEFDRVLMIGGGDNGARIGQPTVSGASVTASVLGEIKGDKITIRKRHRRKGYELQKGHRQKYLRVRVDKISA